MKMKTIKTFVGLAATLLLTVSCASEDTAQNNNQKKETNTGTYAVFIAGKEKTEPSKTRTSLDYDTGNFFWEQGDNIFVKDDGGIWRTGTNPVDKNTVDLFRFQLPGSFTGTNYTVFYPGKNGTNDQVTIATAQTQTAPATTTHFGEAGDCGLATANKTSTVFSFWIDHKAAYLVFQPYTNDALLKDCYLTKIEVISDNNIAGTYTLDPITKKLTGTGTDKTIILTTKAPSGTYVNGFPMTTTSASLSTNGAYMVIAPGYHKLRVRYWLRRKRPKEGGTPCEGTVTKDLPTFNYEANNYYDMAANLTITHYPGNAYYTWDAQQPYWAGYEWDNPVASKRQQETPTFYNPDASTYAPKITPMSASNPRGYNPLMAYNDPTGVAPAVLPTTTRFQACPNVNELFWYAKKGNPHFDKELWACMGVVETGGMWFLKKKYIQNFDKNHAPDETTDYTRSLTYAEYSSAYPGGTPISHGRPAADELDKYFFLPCAGRYQWNGSLVNFGWNGFYWSSTPVPPNTLGAYFFVIQEGGISFSKLDSWRYGGYRVDWPADR